MARRVGEWLLCAACATALPAQAANKLTRLSLEELFDVTVVGASRYEQKQSEVAAAVSVVTRDEIRTFGWRTLGQALASLPGMYLTYDRQYVTLGARGFGLPGDFNTRVLVTVNGNRVNDPLYDGAAVGRDFPLDMDLVERIEFIPGPGGAVYGQNAMFGVVNVVTRAGAELGGTELAAGYQSPQSLREGRASWGRRLDNGIDLVVSVSGMHARGDDRHFDFGAAGVSGVAVGLDGESSRQALASAARGPWSIELMQSDRRKDDPTAGYLSDPLVAGQYQSDRYTLAQLAYEDPANAGTLHLSGRVFAGREDYDSKLSYGTLLAYPGHSAWRGGEARLVSTAWAQHKLMLGLEYQDNVRIDQYGLDLARPANDIAIVTPGYRAGLYAQDEWRFAEAITVTLGLRADRNDVTGLKASPRVALIWQADAVTTLKALYGQAHRAPNAYEAKYDDGLSQVANPALRGERIDTFELVADHRLGHDLALRASVYRWTMRDIITAGIDPVSGLSQYQSGSPVEARGLEASVVRSWANGARLRGSVALQDVSSRDKGVLPNSPKVLGRLNLSSPLPVASLHLGYELQYDGPRRTLAGADLGGSVVSNLHLSTAALGKGWVLSLAVTNLADKKYAHPAADTNWQDSLEQDGRSTRVALTCSF